LDQGRLVEVIHNKYSSLIFIYYCTDRGKVKPEFGENHRFCR